MAEGSGLLNRQSRNVLVGSNPTSSAVNEGAKGVGHLSGIRSLIEIDLSETKIYPIRVLKL